MARRQISTGRVFTYLMVASVLALLLPRRLTDSLDNAVSVLLGPLARGSRDLTLTVAKQVRKVNDSPVSVERYSDLVNQLDLTQRQLVNLRQENRLLRKRFAEWSGLSQRFGLARASLISAHIVGSDSSGWRQIKMLDQGAAQQIEPGQIVLASAISAPSDADADEQNYQMCVVGRICQVGPRSSRLQLISDPQLTLPVFIEPVHSQAGALWRAQGVLGVVKGNSLQDVEVVVNMVSVPDHPIQVGDAVLACSDADYLPVETLAGYVKSCQPRDESPLHWKITVAPAVDLHTLGNVTIVRMNKGHGK